MSTKCKLRNILRTPFGVLPFVLLFFLWLEIGIAESITDYYGPKQRIAVGEVEVIARGAPRDLAGKVGEMLTTALHQTDRFIVLERRALNEILAEQHLSLTGLIDPATAARVGHLLGVQALIKAVITDFDETSSRVRVGPVGVSQITGRIAMDVRIFDTMTGVILFSQNISASKSTSGGRMSVRGGAITIDAASPVGKAIQEVLDKTVDHIIDQMRAVPWQGRVALSEADTVYINAGRNLGLRRGDHLEVYDRGREIKDPDTGLSLGFQKTSVGLLRIDTVEDAFSIARVVSGQPGSEGDIVEYVTMSDRYLKDHYDFEFDVHSKPSLRSRTAVPEELRHKSIVVIIPETHIRREIQRTVPDPAAETEIIKKLVEAGFKVVDQIKVADMRYTEITRAAIDDVRTAISLAGRFDADLIIIGEAFSQWATEIAQMHSCRARAEARIIDMHTGRIIAADGAEASAVDISEEVAGKKALQDAGSQLGDYFIEQLLAYSHRATITATEVEVLIKGIRFLQLVEFEDSLSRMEDILGLQRISYADETARINVMVDKTASEFANNVVRHDFGVLEVNVVYFSPSKIELEVISW